MRANASGTRTTQDRHVQLLALFAVYVVLLVWIILWKLEIPWVGAAALRPRPLKLIPFVASGDAGPSAPLEVLANIALFVPFGAYLALLAPRWPLWKPAAVLVGSSLALEITQHLLSVGTFDVTDVIDDTAGGLLGIGLLALARRGAPAAARSIATRALLIGTVLALIGVGLFVASPLRFHQPRDHIVSTMLP